ncbi:hypothetical protein RB195_021885 [Necator americanus]|uniref:Reverse transcriptase domain-containing protein n=1 Tax=Necator americanus TaxID=51031 RepID=A0ABR1ED30_NECAM
MLPARRDPAFTKCDQALECTPRECTSYFTCTVIWQKLTLQKGAVVQHHTEAHIVKGRMLGGNTESLVANIRLVTLKCRSLSNELKIRKFVSSPGDTNQRTTAAVRTPTGCATPFKVETGVRQPAVVGPILFNVAVDDIMWRTIEQCTAVFLLAPSACPLVDLEHADDIVIFALSSVKLHVVCLVSKLAAAYELGPRPDKCKQIWVSSRSSTRIRVDRKSVELADGLCYLDYIW